MARRFGLVVAALVAGLSTLAACDSCGKPDAGPDAATSDAGAPTDEAASGTGGDDEPSTALDYDGSPGDLGKRFRDSGPKVEAGSGDAEAPIDRACTGASLSFVAVLVDPKCAIGLSRAKQLRAEIEASNDGGAAPLKQEAKLDPGPSATPDGIRVEVKLVNVGKTTLNLPLSHHSKLPAFTALAEDAHKAIYELEPPKLENVTDATKPRFAVMALAPGGKATATVNVGTTVARRIAPACDAGTGGPPSLPQGKYTLHIGQLVTDVEAGAPARGEITVP